MRNRAGNLPALLATFVTLIAPAAVRTAGAAPNVARSAADAAVIARLRDAFVRSGVSTQAAPIAPSTLMDGAGTWRDLVPPARQGASAVFDPARDRMLLFGGRDQALRDETWSFEPGPARWTRLAPGGRIPQPRSGSAMAYDATRDRLWMFGGSALSGLWSLDLANGGTWTQLHTFDVAPDTRSAGALVRDPARDRLVLFGGQLANSSVGGGATGDVWTLDPKADTLSWTRLEPTGDAPAARWGAIAVFDAPRDRIVVIGGRDRNTVFTDAWELRFSSSLSPAWARLTVYGASPPARDGALGVLDEAGGRIVTVGGLPAEGGATNPDVWNFQLTGVAHWTHILPAGPPPTDLGNASAAWDPNRQAVVVHGGGLPYGQFPSYASHQTWVLDLGGTPAWRRVAPASADPAPRYGQATAVSPGSDAFWIFGGLAIRGTDYAFANDLWRADLADPEHWTALHPTGPAPMGRRSAVAAYDTQARRLVMFGGWNYDAPTYFDRYLGDTWSVAVDSPSVWTPLAGDGPAQRTGHVGLYAPLRHSLLVFGGINADSTFGDLWELPLDPGGTWRRLVPEGEGPSPRYFANAVYDAHHDRMILYGGTIDARSQSDVWALSLGTSMRWTRLDPGGFAPGARSEYGAAYDAARGRMLMWGGYDAEYDLSSSTSGVWALSLDGAPFWQFVEQAGPSPLPAVSPSTLYDAARDRMVTFGGSEYVGAFLSDFRVLEFDPGDAPRAAWIAGVRATADGALLVWQTARAPGTPVTVEKRIDVPAESPASGVHEQPGDWIPNPPIVVGADGTVEWQDSGAHTGATYRYRLVIDGVPTGETVVTFAGTPRFALEGVRPQPSMGALTLSFRSSGTGPVRLALHDVRGRRVDEKDLGELPEGAHTAAYELPPGLGAGVYFLQMRQNGSAATRKVVFAR